MLTNATYCCDQCGCIHNYDPDAPGTCAAKQAQRASAPEKRQEARMSKVKPFMPQASGQAGKPRRSKYGARKTEYDGCTFDSKLEAEHYAVLQQREAAGEISHLKRQPVIPIWLDDKHVCNCRLDYSYFDEKDVLVIEDAKGVKTPIYRLKKKLVKALGLEIVEITKGGKR